MGMFSIYSLIAQNDSICGILPQKNGIVTFDNVIKIDSVDAKNLYKNTKLWIAQNFVSSKAVIESDVENSMISLSANIVDDAVSNYSFKMSIQFKDNRFKYNITDIVLHMRFSSGSITMDKHIEEFPAMTECKKETLIEIRNKFENLIKSLASSMNKKADNW